MPGMPASVAAMFPPVQLSAKTIRLADALNASLNCKAAWYKLLAVGVMQFSLVYGSILHRAMG